jgi:MFS family permease
VALGGLWRNPDFLKLWGGETISQFGYQVTTLALPLTAILTLSATPGQMGVLNAATYLPFLFLTLFAGVWVDRQRRRPILIASNAGRLIVLGSVPVLAFAHVLRIEYVYLAALLVGVGTVMFDLAYQSYLPSLVDRADLVEGNSKLQVSASAAQVGGPGLGGLLVQLLTAPTALLTNALSYLVSIISLIAIRRPEPAPPTEETGKRRIWRDIAEGLRFTFGNATLRACAMEAAMYNVAFLIMETIFLIYATRQLGLSPGLIGVIISTGAVGALLGSLLPKRLGQRFGIGPTVIWSVIVATVAPVLVPLATGPRPVLILMLIASFFIGGGAAIICSIHVVSLRQSITPDRLLGRMTASYRFLTFGLIPIGALLGGFLGDRIGLRATLFVASGLYLAAAAFIIFSPIRHVRVLADDASSPEPTPEPAAAEQLAH